MGSDLLERKLLLCEELETTLEFFEPGISNSAMNVKFELSAAKIAKFKQQIKSKIINQHEGKTLIFKEVQKAQNAYKILIAGSECKTVLECRLKRLVDQSRN